MNDNMTGSGGPIEPMPWSQACHENWIAYTQWVNDIGKRVFDGLRIPADLIYHTAGPSGYSTEYRG